jgi:hypothetical protein
MSNIHVGTARMRTCSITMYTKSHKPRGLSRAAETGKRITKRTSRIKGKKSIEDTWLCTAKCQVRALILSVHFGTIPTAGGGAIELARRCRSEPFVALVPGQGGGSNRLRVGH